jgi:hypothetical protein
MPLKCKNKERVLRFSGIQSIFPQRRKQLILALFMATFSAKKAGRAISTKF